MKVKKLTFSKLFKLLIILAILFIGYQLIVRPRLFQKPFFSQKTTSISSVIAITDVKKSFEFEAIVVKGKGAERIVFTIVSAELKEEIKVKGESRKVNEGKQFLLLRLEIENDTTEKLAMITSDLIRLVDNEDKKYAPDFHNATVVIDPLSVRKDLVSFIVDAKLKSFKLLVGGLEKEKETVEINF
ncbi:hypothetical protein ISS85_02585 [Candidatus Microgenomates bacterium]|nr:hypothetical protein [Candidatus Microgenomates bacterium]